MKKRSILISMLVIGVVASLIVAATSATFTDQVTSNANTFKAGTLLMSVDSHCGDRVYGGDATPAVTGTTGGAAVDGNTGCDISTVTFGSGDQNNMKPGDSVSHGFEVVNNGSLAGTLSASASTIKVYKADGTTVSTSCVASDWTVTTPTGTAALAAAGSTTQTVSLTLNAEAGNGCQGQIAKVDVTFHLVQA
jgi:predicted ribosomally synthesized peptide with SipW-like signal peptide